MKCAEEVASIRFWNKEEKGEGNPGECISSTSLKHSSRPAYANLARSLQNMYVVVTLLFYAAFMRHQSPRLASQERKSLFGVGLKNTELPTPYTDMPSTETEAGLQSAQTAFAVTLSPP